MCVFRLVRPLLSTKGIPHFKTHKCLGRIKIRLWVQTGPETKNGCVGKGSQQFNGLDWTVQSVLS
jgi:hypothetical protein